MTDYVFRIFLPVYFLIYFAVAFVLKSIITAKRIGKSPVAIPKDESAYALIGFYFKLTLMAIFAYTVVFAFSVANRDHFLAIGSFHHPVIRYAGVTLMLLSLLWTVVAQAHMKDSWRIGIDAHMKTELVTSGLFAVSRNPIFFGMIISLLGLFLATPNAFTTLFLILGYVLIQIQIRLEEEFLQKEHGQKYLAYRQRVRRMI